MPKTYEQKALEAMIRDYITFGWRDFGMSMNQTIESVNVPAMAEAIIAWANKRERRHAK